MNDQQIQHLLEAIQHQQKALGILYNSVKLSNPLAAEEFAKAYANAGNGIAKALAAAEDPSLALR